MEDGSCTPYELYVFHEGKKGLSQQVLRVTGLMVVNAILAGILVGVAVYRPRYRYHAFIRILFLGATTLFLPILSYVASNATANPYDVGQTVIARSHIDIEWFCSSDEHYFLTLYWACLVQIVGINTGAIVAADNREGRNIGLPVAIVVQAIWISYLAIPALDDFDIFRFILVAIFALIFIKMAIRYYAFQKAQRSFALGRNPRLIVGHTVQEGRQYGRENFPPQLIVMGEDRLEVEKGPHGFCFKRMANQGETTTVVNRRHLVTVDKVWLLDDVCFTSVPRLKEVCFSFALFKLLRCRFAGYTVAEAGFLEAYNFFWQVLLKDRDHERVLGIIIDELSFLYQYYYTSFPVSYSNFWLPILNILTSILSLLFCIQAGGLVSLAFVGEDKGQITCYLNCHPSNSIIPESTMTFGHLVFDLVPLYVLIVVVVLAEARDIASYICSNWTKVALTYRYVVNHDTWQRSPRIQKWLGRVLRCQCKLMTHWDDTMNQCSMLVLYPRKTRIVLLMRRFLHLPEKKKNLKVPREVKDAIVRALGRSNGHLADPATCLQTFLQQNREDGGSNILWSYVNKGTADMILVWHIATSILEVRRSQQQPVPDHLIVATHLSRYCAYLVAYVPELLPDDDEWCKSLYKAVKKDSMNTLAGGAVSSMAEAEYNKLVSLLSGSSKHEVLRKGAELAGQLGELREETRSKLLAEFWSEMILYIAPSDNLNGHMEAIARGGELITLCWALLMHAGISSRSSAAGAAAVGV